MNLRGKGTVSMSKTPLEWANLRSAGQVPCPVPREGGRVGGCGERPRVSISGEEAVGTGLFF